MSSFKRVISHEELGSLCKKMSVENEEEKLSKKMPAKSTITEAPVAVIETTSEEQEESAQESPSKQHFHQISTLSGGIDEAINTQESFSGSQGIISRNELNLARLDSRASAEDIFRSQRTGSGWSGSSGTFGWFIDVHGGEGTPKAKDDDGKKKALSDKEKGDLLHDDYSSADELTQFIDISQQGVESGEF